MVAVVDDERKALMAGLAGFAREPFDYSVLCVVEPQMRREPPSAQPCVKIGPLVYVVTGIFNNFYPRLYGVYTDEMSANERHRLLKTSRWVTDARCTPVELDRFDTALEIFKFGAI